MKHTTSIILLFMSIFLLSQVVGLLLVSKSIEEITQVNGTIEVKYYETALGDRPETEGYGTLAYILVGVAIGTVLLLILVKLKKINLWKLWFFLAVWISITLAIGVFFKGQFLIPGLIALALAVWKIYRYGLVIQNLTEVLMYAGIAVLFVPLLSVWVIFIILIVMSAYDMYAVWKSKHMVKMAEFTTQSNLFPGIVLSYRQDGGKTQIVSHMKGAKYESPVADTKKAKLGVLGGGDVIFPLLFSGAVMNELMMQGMTKYAAMHESLIISLTTAAALFCLFYFGKKNRYYPAMPFVTVGCVLGYLIIILI